jgi:hypothetical protein
LLIACTLAIASCSSPNSSIVAKLSKRGIASVDSGSSVLDSLKCGPHSDMEAQWQSGTGICAAGNNLHLYAGSEKLIGHYISVNLGTFEEIDSKGKVVRKAKLGTSSNNGFNSASVTDQIFSVNYQDSDNLNSQNTINGGAQFSRTISFGIKKETQSTPIACSGCRSGQGACRMDGGGRRGIMCADMNTSGICPTGYNMCTSDILVERDSITLSYEVTNWIFKSPVNILRYTVELSLKKDTGVFADNESVPSELDLRAFIEQNLSSTAKAVSPNGASRTIGVSFTLQSVGKNTIEVSIETPSLAEGEVLTY